MIATLKNRTAQHCHEHACIWMHMNASLDFIVTLWDPSQMANELAHLVSILVSFHILLYCIYHLRSRHHSNGMFSQRNIWNISLKSFQVASGSVSNSWITSTTILRTSRLQPRHTLFFGCISKDFKTSHVSSVAPRDSKWIKMPSCHKPYHIFPSQDEAPSDGHVWICNSQCW